jgi:hypothetical protein
MENEPAQVLSSSFNWVFEPKKGSKTNGLALGNMVLAQNEEQLK